MHLELLAKQIASHVNPLMSLIPELGLCISEAGPSQFPPYPPCCRGDDQFPPLDSTHQLGSHTLTEVCSLDPYSQPYFASMDRFKGWSLKSWEPIHLLSKQ